MVVSVHCIGEAVAVRRSEKEDVSEWFARDILKTKRFALCVTG